MSSGNKVSVAVELLDPTSGALAYEAVRVADRPARLAGRVIGVLENRKRNADTILEDVARGLVRDHGAAGYVMVSKPFSTRMVEEVQMQELLNQADLVLTGIGA